MKEQNYIKLEFPSRSSNEFFARSAVAAFAAQLDPTLEELGDVKTAALSKRANERPIAVRGGEAFEVAAHTHPPSRRVPRQRRDSGGRTPQSAVDDHQAAWRTCRKPLRPYLHGDAVVAV